MAKDYYTVIGVPRGASQEEVKQAYRRLAREYHPDVRKDDPQANERFKEINEAYYVLSDPDRRPQYARFGRAAARRAAERRSQQQPAFGRFPEVVTCRECGGRGTVIRHPCRECGGTGRRGAAPDSQGRGRRRAAKRGA